MYSKCNTLGILLLLFKTFLECQRGPNAVKPPSGRQNLGRSKDFRTAGPSRPGLPGTPNQARKAERPSHVFELHTQMDATHGFTPSIHTYSILL